MLGDKITQVILTVKRVLKRRVRVKYVLTATKVSLLDTGIHLRSQTVRCRCLSPNWVPGAYITKTVAVFKDSKTFASKTLKPQLYCDVRVQNSS